jgi:WhiB family redox-sensing transcriptional regulator
MHEDQTTAYREAVDPEVIYRQLLPFLKVTEKDPSWRDLAACRNKGVKEFFGSGPTRKSESMCSICVVKQQCLQFALDNEITYGVWGGVASRNRKKMLS